jgi:two-component system phosphate regulon sensor histidine kinase PhoR
VRISDNGEGIEQQRYPASFLNALYRIKVVPDQREAQALVWQLYIEHKEKIYVESEFGIGSRILIYLKKPLN